MNKIVPLSIFVIASLYANDIQLQPINIESTFISEVAQKAQKSADVAQSLTDSVPSIDMNRRSGIANDIFIRGQKRDNISVEVDGTKIYGACPNRMDPPISHIVANQIDSIKVTEGPYDVTTYGNMSGGVKITTKKPTKDLKASLNLGFGAWNYRKFGTTLSGGNDLLRVLLTASRESSDQYHDGDGNTLAQQVKKSAPKANQYQPKYEDMQAYTKKSIKAKAFITTATNQELRLSVTANRSDNVLYANSPMDAMSDDSNIYSVAYNIDNISDTYKNINLEYYYSDVDHPMSTEYRNKATTSTNNLTNHMWTTMQGIKLKNSFDFESYKLLIGLDGSRRTWKGEYVNNVSSKIMGKSLDDALTKNSAFFTKVEKKYGDFNLKVGARYDHSTIEDDSVAHQSNSYDGFNANIFTTYTLNDANKLFLGFGQAYRVPDGRELYFMKSGKTLGTPNLKQTRNQEVDFGYKLESDSVSFKIKTFYSKLDNYIYINSTKSVNIFENIDASVYGAELSSSLYLTDAFTIDMKASYKRGKKEHALAGQTNTNIADMAPLRGKIALHYDYAPDSTATLEAVASDRWKDIDSDNGEQLIAGWAVLNAKVKHAINKKFDFTLGVNNLFDKTYAQSNTYVDLTLVTADTKEGMLLHEPGRYIYTNLDFKF